MRFLDELIPKRSSGGTESRYSFQQWLDEVAVFGGNSYALGQNTTYGKNNVEAMDSHFTSYVGGALKSDGVVSAITLTRLQVFSQARFLFQQMVKGRPGELYGNPTLSILERPWPGGTTSDLLAKMELHSSFAGNFYCTRVRDEIVVLRPDWVEILLAPRVTPMGEQLGYERVGYAYYEGGPGPSSTPVVLLPNEVCHYAPYPDPEASHRGMSWLTPVAREIQADRLATEHKAKFFENAATPNLHVKHPQMLSRDQFDKFVEIMEENHSGAANAYKTLYTHGGADVTVVGRDMQQMDFKATQGAGETRLAAAAGVHPVIVGLSEGMQGSSLNAGNYQAAKRVFVDRTMRHLWQNAAGSLQNIMQPPAGSRLWYDARDIPFLREDEQDRANVQQTTAITIRNLVDAGYTPDSVVAAVNNEDMSLLIHSGLYSVQLNPAGMTDDTPTDGTNDDE